MNENQTLENQVVDQLNSFSRQSEKTDELDRALLFAQASFGGLEKDKYSQAFRFNYASLDSVLKAVKVPLNENGILLTQYIGSSNTRIMTLNVPQYQKGSKDASSTETPFLVQNMSLVTQITHAETGQYREVTTCWPVISKIGSQSVQEFGKTITYLRRYSIISLLFVNSEEDTDGGDGNSSASTLQVSSHWTESGDNLDKLLRTIHEKDGIGIQDFLYANGVESFAELRQKYPDRTGAESMKLARAHVLAMQAKIDEVAKSLSDESDMVVTPKNVIFALNRLHKVDLSSITDQGKVLENESVIEQLRQSFSVE